MKKEPIGLFFKDIHSKKIQVGEESRKAHGQGQRHRNCFYLRKIGQAFGVEVSHPEKEDKWQADNIHGWQRARVHGIPGVDSIRHSLESFPKKIDESLQVK